jgi:hypothetical protein
VIGAKLAVRVLLWIGAVLILPPMYLFAMVADALNGALSYTLEPDENEPDGPLARVVRWAHSPPDEPDAAEGRVSLADPVEGSQPGVTP